MPLNTLEEFLKEAKKYINYENALESEKLKWQKIKIDNKVQCKQKRTNHLSQMTNRLTKLCQSMKVHSQGRIMNEIMNMELKDVDLDIPKLLRIVNG